VCRFLIVRSFPPSGYPFLDVEQVAAIPLQQNELIAGEQFSGDKVGHRPRHGWRTVVGFKVENGHGELFVRRQFFCGQGMACPQAVYNNKHG
jgi:hypothetical protein